LSADMLVTVNKDKDGNNLIPGHKYYFKVIAYNSKGFSDYSHEIVVAASPLPATPS